MIKNNGRKVANKKNESVEDPHELLLSLVDLGSLDAEEALLACVTEMSDAECKRVLGSLSLPNCCDEVDEPADDADMEVEFPSDDEEADDEDEDDAEDVEFEDADEADEEDEDEIELEARIRRLERSLRMESRRRFNRR